MRASCAHLGFGSSAGSSRCAAESLNSGRPPSSLSIDAVISGLYCCPATDERSGPAGGPARPPAAEFGDPAADALSAAARAAALEEESEAPAVSSRSRARDFLLPRRAERLERRAENLRRRG